METVKVDLQKLQQLNDRISQAIEALNQVRMSTHGLQHTSAPWQVSPWAQPPIGPVSPLLGNPYVSAFGLQHSVPFHAQQGIPYSPFAQQGTPFGSQAFPFGSQVTGHGISHTSPQVAQQLGLVGPAGMADSSWMQRVMQTFPFVSSPFPITY
jgi:hypothetical protein